MGIVAGAVMAGLSVASSLKKSKDEKNQAKANAAAQEAEWRQRLLDTKENYKQIAQQEQQVNQEYREDLMQNQISLAQQKAQVELMASASGTGGQSVTAMLTDLSTTAGQNQSRIVQNFENEQQSFSNQLRAAQLGGQVTMRKFDKPSASSTILGAANAGMQGYMAGESMGKKFEKAYTDSRRTTNIKKN